MSTFAVFGMTEHFAREEAKKKTPAKKTMQEWLDAVEARVDQVLEGSRCVQLSNLFDAPPVCTAVHRAPAEVWQMPRPEDPRKGESRASRRDARQEEGAQHHLEGCGVR
jgi:hypothetical protein